MHSFINSFCFDINAVFKWQPEAICWVLLSGPTMTGVINVQADELRYEYFLTFMFNYLLLNSSPGAMGSSWHASTDARYHISLA
jgi:hypothetical protein